MNFFLKWIGLKNMDNLPVEIIVNIFNRLEESGDINSNLRFTNTRFLTIYKSYIGWKV